MRSKGTLPRRLLVSEDTWPSAQFSFAMGEYLGERRSAAQPGCARRASQRQHIFLRQRLGAIFRYRQHKRRSRNSDLRTCGWSGDFAHGEGRLRHVIHDGMFDHGVDRSDNALASATSAGAPWTVRWDVRVVHPGVVHYMPPVHDSHKAQQVQPDEYRRKQQPVRYGFLTNHHQT